MSQQSIKNARVAVVGAGGVGSYFGARAALAGAEVTLCLRRPRPELVVRSGGEELRPAIRTVSDPTDLKDVDWVFLAVKAHQTAGAATWLKVLDRPGTDGSPVVVIMQNGVHLPERLHGLWSGSILPAVVYAGVEMVSPGVVVHRTHGFVEVQEGELTDRLATVFGPDPKEVHPVPDIARSGWEKLLGNAVGNSITALTLRRMDVFSEPGVVELEYAVMAETVAVAAADGVTLPADMVDVVIGRLRGLPAEQGSSMLYDRLAGKELEHEALVGAVVQIGADHGIPTPASSLLLSLLRAVSGRPLP